MKKILLVFFVVSSMVLTSCIKNPTIETSPVAAGKLMYAMVKDQNIIALEPVNIAFRLDIMLNEFAAAGKNIATDRLNIKLTGLTAEFDLHTKLFDAPSNVKFELVDPSTQKWKVTYMTGYSNTNDIRKTGSIYITTHGKPLNSLGYGDSWQIGFETAPLVLTGANEINYCIGGADMYMISGIAPGEWDIEISRLSCFFQRDPAAIYSELTESDWSVSQRITSSGWTGMYEGALKAEFRVETGSGAEGATFYSSSNAYRFTYNVEVPLRYHVACENTLMYEGTERVEFVNPGEVNTTEFPASYVTVNWQKNSTNSCYATATVRYNGYIE